MFTSVVLVNAMVALLASTLVNATGQIVITSKMRGIVSGRFDPVMSPGQISQHVHRVLGASNFNVNYDASKLRASECSNLHSQADKSNYWHPTLYKVVVNETTDKWQYEPMYARTRIYYNFPELAKGAVLEAFPESFQMIAGDPYKKVGDRYLQEDMSIFWFCFKNDANGKDISYQSSKLPMDGCANIVSKVFFPSCWNGQPFDLNNPWAHVKYPEIGGGLFGPNCPAGFERRLPSILIETFYFGAGEFGDAPSYGGNGDTIPTYILANGDTTGYGLHADFQNGWDTNVLKRVVAECQNPPFTEPAYEACPALKDTWSYDAGDACNLSTDTLVPNESIGWEGPLDALPGCNAPWASGPKPTCENYVETTLVPWTRQVGAEDNETPSLAELGKAPNNDGAVAVQDSANTPDDTADTSETAASTVQTSASSAAASASSATSVSSAAEIAVTASVDGKIRIPLKWAKFGRLRKQAKWHNKMRGSSKARMV